MFHILNGSSTATLLLAVDLPGRKHAWGDLLMEGPLAVNPLAEEVLRKRAAYLEERFGMPVPQYLGAMMESTQALGLARAAGEVAIWMEEDLFCQTHTVYLLHALQNHPRVSIVSPPHGPIKGKAHELTALFEKRVAVTPERFALASRAWRALTSPEPALLARMAREGDFTAWPALKSGLAAQVARFPSTKTGLGFVEERALKALKGGASTVPEVMLALANEPGMDAYGVGDVQVGAYLARLSKGNAPLVDLRGEPAWKNLPGWKLSLTDDGKAVLAGREDVVRLRGLDHWIGGVHLRGMSDVWRYSPETGALSKR